MNEEDDWKPKIHSFQRIKNDLEAIRVDTHNVQSVASWCGGEVLANEAGYENQYVKPVIESPILRVPNIHGQLDAHQGDWVVRDEHGRFSVIMNEIFRSEYEVKPTHNQGETK